MIHFLTLTCMVKLSRCFPVFLACLLTACTSVNQTVASSSIATPAQAYEPPELYDTEALAALLPEDADVTYIEKQVKALKIHYTLDGEQKFKYIKPEKIMYEDYGTNCGWTDDELENIISTWELNNKVDADFESIEAYEHGYKIHCIGNGMTYILVCDATKAFLTSVSEVSTDVEDRIHAEYPNLEKPYTVKSVTDSEIVFVKDGKEFVIKNE